MSGLVQLNFVVDSPIKLTFCPLRGICMGDNRVLKFHFVS